MSSGADEELKAYWDAQGKDRQKAIEESTRVGDTSIRMNATGPLPDNPASPPSASEITEAIPEFVALLDQYGKACSEDWVADALRYKEGLRRVYREQLQEIERLRKDGELLDWVDTLPSGACILGDALHPQSMCMTPKAQGFSHTRQLIRDARESRRGQS